MAGENKFINATAFDKTLCNMIRNICAGGGGSQVADGVCLALAQLRAAPAADVVDVVRCKDCKHCMLCYPEKQIDKDATPGWYCKDQKKYRRPDDFCSYGEKRGEE